MPPGVEAAAPRPAFLTHVPLLLLTLFAATAPVASVESLFDQVALPRLALTFIFTGLAAAALLAAARGRSIEAIWPGRRVGLWLTVLFLTTAVSTAFAVDPRNSFIGEFQRYQGLLPMTVYWTLMLVTAAAVRLSQRSGYLGWGIFAGGTAAGVYVLLDAVGLDWLDWEVRDPTRAGGLFGQPNVLALQLLVAAMVSGGLLARPAGWQRDLAAAGLGCMLGALVLTYSRGGWSGALVALALFLWLTRPINRRWTLILGGLAIGLIGLLSVLPAGHPILDSVVKRAESGIDPGSGSTRFGLWQNAVEMAADHPILGAGPDGFSALFPEYREAGQPGVGTGNVRPESSHNLLLDQLVGVGAVGLVLFLGLVGTILLAGARAALRIRGLGAAPLASPVAAVLGYYVATMFSFAEAMTGWLPWLLMGAIIGLVPQEPPRPWSNLRRGLVIFPSAAWSIILCLGGVVLLVADSAAGPVATDLATGQWASAIDDGQQAVRWNPFSRAYLITLADAEVTAAEAETSLDHLQAAQQHYHALNTEFAPTAHTLVSEALLLASLGEPDGEVRDLLDAARTLDPYNAVTNEVAAQVEAQLLE